MYNLVWGHVEALKMGDNYGYVFEGTSHNFKQKYEIWGGISMFNLVTTQGIHDGEHVEVRSCEEHYFRSS